MLSVVTAVYEEKKLVCFDAVRPQAGCLQACTHCVSTVTFYQSHRHLLQKYYYAEFALHMFTFCHASLHSASV